MADNHFDIPDPNYHFRLPGDRVLTLDPIATIEEMDRIAEQVKGQQSFRHLDMFVKWLSEVGGADLSRAEADKVWEAVYDRYYQGKEEWRASHGSTASTESEPADCPPTSAWDSTPT